MKHKLLKLEYGYDSLEPFIDAKTMKIHHGKHHQAYVDKLNVALEGDEYLQKKTAEQLVKNLDKIPEKIRIAIRNNGGGHVNHSFFWKILKKGVGFDENSEIGKAIVKKAGSYEKFKEHFTEAALTQFGSGWAWLYADTDGDVGIMKTSNQDSPMSEGKIPLLALDVWEHAYYLKYQNKRPEYVEAFFSVINWKKVDELYKEILK
ncbi:MAG: superoxide dismutase [Nanoarchaeota archaeon]|nr:superoxide dismutase [Nanoarchaeota archaeon]